MSLGLLETPKLGKPMVELRPYQKDAVEAVRGEYRKGRRSTLMLMATGLGKTLTFGMAARMTIGKGGRALVLAHQKELISQAVNKLDMLGVEAAVERAQHRARALFEPSAVVATVQTMKGDRLAEWPTDYFNLVVVDEAHHAVAASYRNILKHFRKARVLGVTATCDRGDGEDLGQVFESVACNYDMFWGMTAPPPGPYLCRLRYVQCALDVDLRSLRPSKDDFSDADLEPRIAPIADILANTLHQEIGDRRTMVFTPGVKSAQGIATALQCLGRRADWVSGDDPDREKKVESFEEGACQILVTCGIGTEGFDVPEIAAVGLFRPTKSRALQAQMIGRGTRPVKPDCLIIDVNWLTTKHDLVGPAELFDTPDLDSDVIDMATKAIDDADHQPVDLMEAIVKSKAEHERRQVFRVQATERKIAYRKVAYDPLSVYDAMGLGWRGPKDAVVHRATAKQAELLGRLGVQDAPMLSRHKASTLLDYLINRRKAGLATVKQVSWAIAKGKPPDEARRMTFYEASAFLDSVFQARR